MIRPYRMDRAKSIFYNRTQASAFVAMGLGPFGRYSMG